MALSFRKDNTSLALFLALSAILWSFATGILFLNVERYPFWSGLKDILLNKGQISRLYNSYRNYADSLRRHYPENIKFEGNKADQYFMHGRNYELSEKVAIDRKGQFFIQVRTTEAYRLFINGNFVAFNWAPDYRKAFGTNREFKNSFPIIDATGFLRPGQNEVRITGNFSFEKPGRNYIAFDIIDGNKKIIFSKRENLPLIPVKPFYTSLSLWLSILSFLYLICYGKNI